MIDYLNTAIAHQFMNIVAGGYPGPNAYLPHSPTAFELMKTFGVTNESCYPDKKKFIEFLRKCADELDADDL